MWIVIHNQDGTHGRTPFLFSCSGNTRTDDQVTSF
jgi:hypothetical protein